MWPLFKSGFRHHFIAEVTITAIQKEIRTLLYSRGVGDVVHFNTRFPERIGMLPKGLSTIMREDPLYDEYCSKLPAGIADQIITSARMQKTLQPATPVTLADAMEMVGEFSECATSHSAVTATPVTHGTNFVPPITATIPTPVGPELMDLTVANASTRCYHCDSFGHEVRDCATLDMKCAWPSIPCKNVWKLQLR
jgi:hypothetical protein